MLKLSPRSSRSTCASTIPDLSNASCFTGDLRGLPGGGDPLGTSRWCGSAFIAKGSFDLTWLTNLKL
ncbi:MAG: hypothetical protein ACJ8EN_23445 [Xanthobacteraceae bacterium]